ncbi:MAG: STAS/SEC14 domain-containing protein [Myxococcales bacterium]|nr:STAS/SEC14 domain-containing protein [Myxococcales bacterium]
MLEALTDLPPGIVGVRATGTVTKDDYEAVLEPLFARARREGHRVKFVYQFAPEFDHFTPGAAWEDARMGVGALRLLEGCAVVGDVGWIRESVRMVGFLAPCPVRTFGSGELAAAVEWLESLPGGGGTAHRLLPDEGVLVVEVRGELRAQDFDALAATVDPWLESHGELRGLVIHSRKFPGWESLGSLVRHITFVRDHHRKVRHVALVSDSALAGVAPRLAEHFVDAQIEHFEYDALDRAIAWAARPATEGA